MDGRDGTASTGSEDGQERFPVLPAGESAPAILSEEADGAEAELVWRNGLGGQTWRLGDRYVKWSPRSAGVDLDREALRLHWLGPRFPAPRVCSQGRDDRGSWFITAALPGGSAVSPQWRAQPEAAVHAIAEGLRRLHALDVEQVPTGWTSWATRRPPALGRPPGVEPPVVVHGDACVPNTVVGVDGGFVGIVDVGDLVRGDRWADLAVASTSLGRNFGPGWEPCFFDAYGITPDADRIRYFQRLWDAES